MADSNLGAWSPLAPTEVGQTLRQFRRPWWIAGGWALDLFLGRQTREHEDTDIGVLRRDHVELQQTLTGWDLQAADPPGTLRAWMPLEELGDSIHDIWCRRTPKSRWCLQVMLDEANGDDWVYRRDARVRLPLKDMLQVTDSGLPYLRPEVQLLYKSKDPRTKSQADFASVLPHLGHDRKLWLKASLEVSDPDNGWLRALQTLR